MGDDYTFHDFAKKVDELGELKRRNKRKKEASSVG